MCAIHSKLKRIMKLDSVTDRRKHLEELAKKS